MHLLFNCVFKPLFRANCCTVHGTKYKKGAVVHTGSDGIFPQFSMIQKIVTVPAKDSKHVFFALKEIATVNYESHSHAYRVKHFNQVAITIRRQSELITYRPMHICKSIGDNQTQYVCPRIDVDVYSEQV